MLKRPELIEVLRWIAVLPAAVLGAMAVQFLIGALVQLTRHGGWDILGGSSVSYPALFLLYMPRKAAFVIAGALTAPRHHIATALVLAVLGLCISLMIHIIGQHLAGNHVGPANYTHFLAESAGLLCGFAGIFWLARALTLRSST